MTLDQLQEALIDKLRLIVEPLISKFGIEKLRLTLGAFDQLQEPLIDKLRQIVERLTP